MKEKLIQTFGLKFIKATKWNDIYTNEEETYVFIFNRATNIWKIKPI